VSARLRIELPARPGEVPSARAAITRLCEHLGLEDELAGQIRLAVTEAYTTCVLHAYDSEAAEARRAARLDVRARGARRRRRAHRRSARRRRRDIGLGFGLRLIRQAAAGVDITSRPGRGTRVAMRFALR
jgi:anti-sigma regulatory factor (Ser/Thr protein kinase)